MNRTHKRLASLLAIVVVVGFVSVAMTQPLGGRRTLPAIMGSGTPGRIAQFTDTQEIGDSVIFQDMLDRIGIGTTAPMTELHLVGDMTIQGPGLSQGGRILIFDPPNDPGIIRGATGNSFIDFRGSLGLRVRTGAVIPIMIWDNGQSEVARIENNGNMGIGTTMPQSPLDVVGEIRGDTIRALDRFIFSDNTEQTTAATGSPWQTIGNDIFYNDGNVGIGTSSPDLKLHVAGNVRIGTDAGMARVFLNAGGINQDADIVYSQSGQRKWFVGMLNNVNDDSLSIVAFANPQSDALTIRQSNGFVGLAAVNPSQRLHVSGNICATGTIGGCSDARFKENIERLPDALPNLLKLRGVHFDWKRDEFPDWKFSDQRQVGLIAQEVLAVLPEVVSKGTDGFYSVDYGRVVPLLVEAIKELHATVKDRDTQIAAQVQQIDDLSARLDRIETMLARLPDVQARRAE